VKDHCYNSWTTVKQRDGLGAPEMQGDFKGPVIRDRNNKKQRDDCASASTEVSSVLCKTLSFVLIINSYSWYLAHLFPSVEKYHIELYSLF
jgi:hypothetical protein